MGDNDCLYCRPCVLSSTLSRVNNPASATATAPFSAPQSLIERCRHEAIRLLRRNASDAGILAASRGARAHSRGYDAVFGRDAAICAIGMALSGDPVLEKCAAVGLETIGAHQAPNGQIPKFVDTVHQEPDFWYLGCIDATLWWLIALEFLDRVRNEDTLRTRHRQRIARAIDWLLAQEHQRFRLLQQNEASDWADIMPRSGFVLYTNALWYRVKCLFDVPHATDTAENINGLFHPFSASLHEYRRGRLLADYVLANATRRDLFLSFVNFSFFGEEGDVFGNVLTVLFGAATGAAAERTLAALARERVQEPYPVRVVCDPILEHHLLWRPYMSRHKQNFAWQYHNGGIWPMVGGFWILALVQQGRIEEARHELVKLAQACELKGWEFNEWLHGRTYEPSGMPGQSWNAAAFLMAEHAVRTGRDVFAGL